MVVKYSNHRRLAFTLIELIFAIVIIAIAVLSLPMMTQINSRTMDNNLIQEAIFAASAELMGASAGYWDTNSMEDSNLSHISRVIDINSDCDSDRLRAGHIAQPFHRRCLDSTTGSVADSPSSTFISLDNAEHTGTFDEIFLNATPDKSGYKRTYYSTLNVTRVDNTKFLTVTVSDSTDTLVVLKMQSANIGEIDYYKRRF